MSVSSKALLSKKRDNEFAKSYARKLFQDQMSRLGERTRTQISSEVGKPGAMCIA